MSGRRKDKMTDYDMFDDEIYSSQRKEAKARPVPKSKRTKARERRVRQLKNRSLIIIVGVVILVLIIVLFSVMIKGCDHKDKKVINVSTETIAKQQAKAATPSEAAKKAQQNNGSGNTGTASMFKTPNITDDNSQAAVYGPVCVWNNTGSLKFTPDSGSAEAYAAAVNGLADKASSAKVYNMVVPSSAELCLPARLRAGEFNTASQAEFITSVNNALGSNVTSVNAYDALCDHNSDYIYYKTDDNWTDLGAYYGYDAFAKAAGLTPIPLTDCEDKTIEGFFGCYSLYTAAIDNDTVHYRYLPYDAPMDVTDQSGNTYTNPSPYYEGATSGAYTYGVFLVGDNPISVIKSSSTAAQSGKKIAVVKEDYGDALAPYLSYNYSEVHIIDYRYFDMMGTTISDYCSQNGITDILVINDVASAGSSNQINSLSSIN